MTHPNRRSPFYRTAGALALFACMACSEPQPQSKPVDPPGWNDGLAMPEAQDLNDDPNVLELNLEARVVEKELRPGQQTQVWTYNGLLPGPLLRAKVGDRVVVHFTNNLPEATTLHWHGLRVPAAMDGSELVQNPVQPGESFRYEFVVPDAGTYWYHPHVRSSHQVNDGLYGAFIVEDPADPELGARQVMVLSDILLNDDGSLGSPTQGGWLADYFGREGNVLLVNGRVRPKLVSRTGRAQRWQIVNASRARYYWFEVPRHRVYRVGGDAGLIPAPVPVTRILITPGERVELLLFPEGTSGETVTVNWLPYDRGYATGMRPEEPLFDLSFSELPALRAPEVPASLRAENAPVDVSAAGAQLIELTETNVDGQMQLGINGIPSWEATAIEAMAHGTQVWTVKNATDADHPFHLHGFFFQVLEQDGVPPPFREWKDTVNVPAKKTVRLAIPFDDRAGMWMFHCHILDHADLGMMGHLHLMQ